MTSLQKSVLPTGAEKNKCRGNRRALTAPQILDYYCFYSVRTKIKISSPRKSSYLPTNKKNRAGEKGSGRTKNKIDRPVFFVLPKDGNLTIKFVCPIRIYRFFPRVAAGDPTLYVYIYVPV